MVECHRTIFTKRHVLKICYIPVIYLLKFDDEDVTRNVMLELKKLGKIQSNYSKNSVLN